MLFHGSLDFLSNMYNCTVMYNGCTYKCAESAFQAQKCIKESEKRLFVGINGFDAKRLGRKVSLKSNWEIEKLAIMEEIVRAKFLQNPILAKKLISLQGNIQEDNSWNDTFWGVCNGVGENHLGKILMKIRDELNSSSSINLYTSYYSNMELKNRDLFPIGISIGTPINIQGAKYLKLAPSAELLQHWKKFHDEKVYNNVFGHYLMTLNPNEIISELTQMSKGKDIVLLCYEKETFCHRQIVARWLKWAINKEVIEL